MFMLHFEKFYNLLPLIMQCNKRISHHYYIIIDKFCQRNTEMGNQHIVNHLHSPSKQKKPSETQQTSTNQLLSSKLNHLLHTISTYNKLSQKNKQLSTIISLQQINILTQYLHSNVQTLFTTTINNVQKQAPFLNGIQKTIWKCLLIVPIYEYLPLQAYKNQKIYCKFKGEECVRKDISRTFPESGYMDRMVLQNLMIYIYGNVFKKLGYYSGQTLIMALILQCGFNELQAYYLYIALKIHPKYQLVRKAFPKQQIQNTLACQLGISFAQQLAKQYNYVYTVFSGFPLQVQLASITDLMCFYSNWNYKNLSIAINLWNYIITVPGNISAIVNIQVQLAKSWYDSLNIVDQQPKNLFISWSQYSSSLTPQIIAKIVHKLLQRQQKNRSFYNLNDFKNKYKIFRQIQQKEEAYMKYLQELYGVDYKIIGQDVSKMKKKIQEKMLQEKKEEEINCNGHKINDTKLI